MDKIDNGKTKLRIRNIYAQQETRNLNRELKKLYKVIEDNVGEAP